MSQNESHESFHESQEYQYVRQNLKNHDESDENEK